ncbi:MAG: bifunctional UDP-N-acetylglucosamine pyrophosphorylase / glucosamine-phosphate N-acetyltransferase [Gaiellaceae bacterium]|jgi:bifunctional UDP-N-acetylglucosamine pyrophosphorylase/glucosamine-1-phosphate N-acetyltransferase|nr:bifunctional UDP-N-acetylglucosamine pyrophosphorylase / glucosamine-phosphate N-acetyltransferase [Gaiellaceae bacterium]
MSDRNLAAVVLAAGLGTRMRSETPKHLHPLLGRRLADWVIEAARTLGPKPLVVVTSPDARDAFDGVEVAVQEEPRGTGDAAAAARASLEDFDGDVLVVTGDAATITGELLSSLLGTHRSQKAAATVLSFEPPDPRAYGRIVRGDDGSLQAIVEARDASEDELAIGEVNSSIYVFDAAKLWPALASLKPDNAQGELYLTDTVRDLAAAGERVAVHKAEHSADAEGVNTRAELAAAATILRDRINREHMLAGATIVDPASTWIDPSVELEPDCTIQPFTVLKGSTRVARGAEVGPHVVAADAEIGPGALVGPFCYLRPGTVLETGAKAGAFVEIKNSRLGAGVKASHQSYIGDADIGEGTNIGAGNITANFSHEPGKPKGRTTIGRNVRTGVHNAFVAPVEIGDGAWTGAGSVITTDVPPESLAVARARQENKDGYVRKKREQEE